LLLTALLSAAAAASGDRAPGTTGRQQPATMIGSQPAAPDASVHAADSVATVVRAPVIRIYYDLTQYDWYREGRPLETGSGIYVEDGDPVFLPSDSVVRAGEYQGVEYYRRVAGDDSTLLVPVYPNYWLPFSLRGHGQDTEARGDTRARRPALPRSRRRRPADASLPT
jgi:hypothetical protein